MKRTSLLFSAFALLSLLVSACAPPETPALEAIGVELTNVSVDVYHSPGCSCCLEWVAYLEDRGADVTLSEVDDMAQFKAKAGVPAETASCHTALIDGYVVEGHVPAEAIGALLASSPDIVGIALPGMPGDSPGMGGSQSSWLQQPVVGIGADGAVAPFEF